jgi:serine/threonine protein kinase
MMVWPPSASPPIKAFPENDGTLINIVRDILRLSGIAGWTTREEEFWCVVEPLDYLAKPQGWKLHVSATPLSAREVLARSCEVLVKQRCAFKFAKTPGHVAELLSIQYDRASAGKFITAYPEDDDHFRRLVDKLHRVTAGLLGPTILSDRPYRPGSLVHFRYGVIAASATLTNDGQYEPMLTKPDGTLVKDERKPWFTPPEWVTLPLPGSEPAQATTRRPRPVLIGNRFLAYSAVTQTNRGGVYRGTDRESGRPVIIKRARPHVGSTLSGSDVRQALLHEARMLDHFSPLGLAPRRIALFDQEQNLFLVEEPIHGVTLRSWVMSRINGPCGTKTSEAVIIATRLIELLRSVHAEGFVYRDLNPDNIMVDREDRLWLVDFELVTRPGKQVVNGFTYGYAAPEQINAPELAPAPDPTADLFGLGALIFFIATGIDPILLEDRTTIRPIRGRIANWLELLSVENPTAGHLSTPILQLMRDEPNRRWSLDHVRAFLNTREFQGDPSSPKDRFAKAAQLQEKDQERLLVDGLKYICETIAQDPDVSPQLWRSTDPDSMFDPCSVQHGAAGVLAVLTRASDTLGDQTLRHTVRQVAAWIDRRWPAEDSLLPGLYFGRSGTAWALYDAAHSIRDGQLAARAVHLAKQIPVVWPNPDICHGAAGAGMTQLYMWRETGDPRFRDRVLECADALISAAELRSEGIVWPIPNTFESELAGLTHYGFAHGVAGIGTFLLAAGRELSCSRYVRAARAAGATLREVAQIDDEVAYWPSGEDEGHEELGLTHWCSGSSGVGTFLLRLWLTTGDRYARDLAEKAAVAVRTTKWQSSPVACHGLAGDGEFLLDLTEALGDRQYREWAKELAAAIFARHALWDGKLVVPDESGSAIAVDYGTGLAGVLAFFIRLRYGGSRMFMVEPCSGLM